MKVKLLLEVNADIPGEFQNDAHAVSFLTQDLSEILDINTQYDKYDQPDVMFTSLKIIQYIPGLGKL
jgi:hypothetical protein